MAPGAIDLCRIVPRVRWIARRSIDGASSTHAATILRSSLSRVTAGTQRGQVGFIQRIATDAYRNDVIDLRCGGEYCTARTMLTQWLLR